MKEFFSLLLTNNSGIVGAESKKNSGPTPLLTNKMLITKQVLIRFLLESENIMHKQNMSNTLGKYQENVTNEYIRIIRFLVSFVSLH